MTNEQRPDQPSLEDLTPLLRINKLCDEFRRAWKDADPPGIEDYLSQVNEGTRESLLRNLLPIDIEARRRRAKESPSSDEYIKRFPKYARLIRQAFFESTMASIHHEVSTPSVAATISLIPVAKRLGDYELIGELGKGGFGVVYEARHVKHGDRVALKTLPLEIESHNLHSPATEEQKRKSGDRLMRFKREFRMLADMNHPNLVGLHSLEADGDQWFFTMDLIEGTDFIDYVRPGGELDEGRLRATMPQLVAGVMALHGRNVIHRDLKPSNVMVSEDGLVSILDFGLVAELENRSHTVSIAGFAGTPAYAAPEQLFAKHTSSSDWYSIGTMLYEALSGRRPYQGYGTDVLAYKQEHDAPPIANGETIPHELMSLAMQLLQRDPIDRPDALAITHAISSDSVPETPPVRGSVGPLIGREPHLAQLQAALSSVQKTSRPHCVFVNGRSGEGKTSLVEHFLDPLRGDRRFVVLSGRCYDRESVPFKAIDGVMDALCSYLQRQPETEVAAFMPDDIAFLIQLFPVLQRIDVFARHAKPGIASLDRPQVLQRGFMALRLLLSRIAEKRVVILFTDDLQWGDEDSAEGVLKIVSDDQPFRLLLIGTYRSDESDESPFLRRWNERQTGNRNAAPVELVGLTPLSVLECRQLLAEHLKEHEDLIDRRVVDFHAKTGGNPYLLVELIGCFDPDTDSFEALALSEVISRKLKRLPDRAKLVLNAIAVAGRATCMPEIFAAVDMENTDSALVTHMRSENLVRIVGSEDGGLVDTYHDKIRETILDEMEPENLSSSHRAMAHAIELVEDIDISLVLRCVLESDKDALPSAAELRAGELAKHYESAGDTTRAFCYALLAAESAVRQFTLPVAVKFYSTAQQMLGDVSRIVRFRLATGYGDCLRRLGDSDEALEILNSAVGLSDDPLEIANVEYLRGECLFQSNRLVESIHCFRRALELCGSSWPTSRMGFAWSYAKERCAHWWKTRLPPGLIPSPRPIDARLAMTVKVLIQAIKPLSWRRVDLLSLAAFRTWNLTHGQQQPTLSRMHYISQSIVDGYLYSPSVRQKRLDRLDAVVSDSGDALLDAFSFRIAAYSNSCQGLYSDSMRGFNKAESLLTQQVQDHYQLISLRWWKAELLFLMGRLSESANLAAQEFDSAVASGDDRIASNLLFVLVWATDGRVPFSMLSSCFRRIEEDLTGQVYYGAAEAAWHLSNERIEEAVEASQQGFQIFNRGGRRFSTFEGVAPAIYAKCLNRQAEKLSQTNPREAATSFRRAKQILNISLRHPKSRTSRRQWLTMLWREYARAQDGLGKTRAALKSAQKSIEIAEERTAKYELAQSRLVVAELAKKLNLPDAERLLREANEGMIEFEQMIEANAAKWERKGQSNEYASARRLPFLKKGDGGQ